jgi:hypothetical protein
MALFDHFPVEFLSDDLKTPKLTKWGSSIIPLYTFTCVHHFWVQFLSDDPQAPKILLNRGIHGFFPLIYQFITNFQCSSFPFIPKTPRFNPARIIKVIFTILTRLHYFCMKFCTYDPKSPKSNSDDQERFFHHSDTFPQIFSEVHVWSSQKHQVQTSSEFTRILFTILTVFDHFSV